MVCSKTDFQTCERQTDAVNYKDYPQVFLVVGIDNILFFLFIKIDRWKNLCECFGAFGGSNGGRRILNKCWEIELGGCEDLSARIWIKSDVDFVEDPKWGWVKMMHTLE